MRPFAITGDADFNEIFFGDVRVPVESVLGESARLGRSDDDAALTMGTLGFARRALEVSVALEGARLELAPARSLARMDRLSAETANPGRDGSSGESIPESPRPVSSFLVRSRTSG